MHGRLTYMYYLKLNHPCMIHLTVLGMGKFKGTFLPSNHEKRNIVFTLFLPP